MPKAHHSGFLAGVQDLNEQPLEGIKFAAPELTDATVIQLLVAGQHPKARSS
jgi:hypothetical protein